MTWPTIDDESKIHDREKNKPPSSPENIALFDLDGTLADFDGGMEVGMVKLATPAEIAAGTYFPREQAGEPDYIRERRRMVKRQPGFWRNLAKLPSGFRLLEIAMEVGYKIAILTKAPRTNFPAWSEKVEWCHNHLPMDKGIAVNLVEDKGLVYGKILVDDYPPYINRWLEWRPRGLVFMPEQSWNRGFAEAFGKTLRNIIAVPPNFNKDVIRQAMLTRLESSQ